LGDGAFSIVLKGWKLFENKKTINYSGFLHGSAPNINNETYISLFTDCYVAVKRLPDDVDAKAEEVFRKEIDFMIVRKSINIL
jgi:hypothetical protein